jgi:hypothetical protein
MPEPELCQIHHEPLVSELAQIIYGLRLMEDGFWKAHEALFPNSFLTVTGGCIVGSVKHRQVMCCHSCRAAEQLWTVRKNRPFSETWDD